MPNWPVMSITELVETRLRYNDLKYNLPRDRAKELRWDKYLAKAQAKHIGELANFIIALVISLAQRQERERIIYEMREWVYMPDRKYNDDKMTGWLDHEHKVRQALRGNEVESDIALSRLGGGE